MKKYQQSKEYIEKSLQSDLKSFGKDHPTVAIRWNNLGLVYYSMGQLENAINCFKKANEINIKNLGDNHPNVALSWNSLGFIYDSMGQNEKAIYYYEKALKVLEINPGKEHPTVKKIIENLDKARKKLK